MSVPLNTLPCTTLKGVGESIAARLQKLGITTVQDLLFHLPFRYQDRTQLARLGKLRIGDYVAIEGIIEIADINYKAKKPSLLIRVSDGSGYVTLRFFYFRAAQKQQFARGKRIRCFGEVRWGKNGFEIVHPEYQIFNTNEFLPVDEHLTPIYSTTEGLSQSVLRKLSSQALELLERTELVDYLPQSILRQFHLSNLVAAIKYVHRPPRNAQQALLESGIHPAQQRLAFEELLAHQLSFRQLRQKVREQSAVALTEKGDLSAKFLTKLPFTLTSAQQRVIAEIIADLAQTKPMLRLVQGDVGSGKTVVAALAALNAIANGFQVALMAPTELLAEQHFYNFRNWFEPLGLKISLLTSSLKNEERVTLLLALAKGEINLTIGTHALFQDEVKFRNLALIIIDEQHRFGVQQRLALRQKGISKGFYPHQLIMTATPIPRTLAMTAYADLDCSIIDELPVGRVPISTVAIANSRRQEVIARVRENCQQNKQAYWICTLIDESEVLQCQAAEETAKQLMTLLPELRIGLLHGRLKSSEKEQIMSAFKNHRFDLLVATTVVEVGVDIPNASLMIIENAERLGLSQLHQLRGRVGRGLEKSHCVLLYQPPLSEFAKQRLEIMRMTNDGFIISQRDLELRGPGELLGTKQAGLMQFKIADLMRDKGLLEHVQNAAESLLHNHSEIVQSLLQRWQRNTEYYTAV